MTEKKRYVPLQSRAATRGASSGVRPAAREAELEFGSEESPTTSMSKPILNLLARATAPGAPAVVPSEPAVAPSEPLADEALKVLEAISAEANTNITPVGMEDTLPSIRFEPRSLAGSRGRTILRASAVSVVVACALAALVWFGSRSSKPPSPRVAPVPVASLATAVVESAALRPAASSNAGESTPAPPSPAASVNALLSADGSEATAPTCDTLLVSIPLDSDHAWGDAHVRAARKALIRGDVEGSQRAFCQAIRANESRTTDKAHAAAVAQVDAAVSLELAQLLLLRRDAVAATTWAQRAQQSDPRSARVLGLLGDTLVRSGNLENARKNWLAAVNLSENDRIGIGRMVQRTFDAAVGSLKERDPARAERLLRRVLAFQPANAEARAKLSVALGQLGFANSAEAWQRATL